ncbi:hypothetical protein M3Y95_00766500 [Aphelenchoides besseyi]|nr:hypothetical protein M3Y95_00766500 [Aphelenchoides besseyi]
MRSSIVLLILVGALMVLEQSWALRCYKCSSSEMPHCDSADEIECDAGMKTCSKEIIENQKSGIPIVSKGCSSENAPSGCKTIGQTTNCYCTGNLCNSSDRPAIASFELFLILLFVFA